MGLNLHSLKRGRQKLEPISIDELACDSTMTGFSDLFRIPTAFRNPDGSKGLKPTSDILESVRTNAAPSEAPPSDTGPSVSAPAADGFQACYSPTLVSGGPDDVPSETGPPVSVPGSESRNVYQRPIQAEKKDLNIEFMDDTGGLVSDPLSIEGVETVTADTGGFVSDHSISMLSAPLQRKLQIREAKLVQEGHTYGEQTVYEALWKHGKVVSDQVRVITVGFLRMAGIAGLAESNCKAAVAGLLDKLTIERLPDRIIAQGRTYKVYNWNSVLSRRRTAGLTHVIKSRGVVFVDPRTGLPLTAAKTPPRRQKREVTFAGAKALETGQRETSGGEKHGPETGGPVSLPRYPSGEVSDLPAPYVNHNISPQSSPERSPVLVVKPSLQNHLEIGDLACRLRKDLDTAFDDSAAARLWRECRRSVLDCTVEEVMHFVLLKSHKIHRDPNIRNPIGLLLMSVPEFFNGNAVHELREQKRREEEQHRELQYQQRRYWKEVADDPSTPLDERNLAAKFLAELGEPR